MGFYTYFIFGFIAGGVTLWKWGQRKQHDVKDARSAEAEVIVVDKADEPVIGKHTVAAPVRTGSSASKAFAPKTTEVAGEVNNLGEHEGEQGSERDNLTAIHGIGPVYAKRLNAGGIQSFVQLAELTPEQITEIVGQGNITQLADTRNWIAQAQGLIDNQ